MAASYARPFRRTMRHIAPAVSPAASPVVSQVAWLVVATILLTAPVSAESPSAADSTLDALRLSLFPGRAPGTVAAIRTTSRIRLGAEDLGTATTVARRSPPAFREVLDLAGARVVSTLLGDDVWIRDPNGKIRPATGDELAAYRLAHAFLFHTYLDAAPPGFRREVTAAALRFEPLDEGAARTLELERRGDLLLPARLRERQQGTWVTTSFGDWRIVDGVRFPFRAEQSSGDPRFDLVMTTEHLEYPDALDDGEIPRPAPSTPADAAILDPDLATDIPFSPLGPLVALDVRVNGSAARFLLDTGAAATVLDADLVDRLGLETRGRLEARGAGGSETAGFVKIDSLELPGVAVRDQTVVTVALGDLHAVLGASIDGILGYDFLSRFAVRVDYARRRVALFAPGSFAAPPGARRAALRVEGNVPRIDGVLDGEHAGSFVLDLGNASSLVLHPAFARRAGYGDPSGAPSGDGAQELSGVGGTQSLHPVRVRSLVLGGMEYRDVPGGVPASDDGALALDESLGNVGAGLFRNGAVAFDYDEGAFWVLPSDSTGPAPAAATADSASPR